MAVSRESGQIYWIEDLNSNLRQVKKKSAKEREFEIKAKALPTWTGPVLASNQLVMTNSLGDAVTFDPKTGKRLKTIKIGGASFISPIAVNDKLYFITDNAKLVAIR